VREATLGAMFPPEWPVAAVSSHLLEFALLEDGKREGRDARDKRDSGSGRVSPLSHVSLARWL